ncbi:MAG: ribosome biogenesis GTP-binding protein YsxC, partial [Acidobacteria bacterium]
MIEAEFVLSASAASQLPKDPLPHVALVGRSNVGKSSLINALMRQKVARTSAKPGKTRLLNAYRVNAANGLRFILVDLPGYGFAGYGHDREHNFDRLVSEYFESRSGAEQPTLALLAVDARHPGLASDIDAWEWIGDAGITRGVVVTKVDKLSGSIRARELAAFKRTFDGPLMAVSAERGEGMEPLWTLIRTLL